MTLSEFGQALKTLSLPVAYSAFKTPQTPPFLVYLYTSSADKVADNQNYAPIGNVQVELYSDGKDLVNEGKVEALLKSLRLPYRKSEAWIQSEKLRQVVYEVQLIGG